MTDSSAAPATSGEVSFATPNNRMDGLYVLALSGSGLELATFAGAAGTAGIFRIAAAAVSAVERERAASSPSALLSLTAANEDGSVQCPLDWLNVTERQPWRSTGMRRNHEFYLVLENDSLVLTFEHGQFGYRSEPHSTWSSAFNRLADVLAGDCTWHQFGDRESQVTMLGKGQFYWRSQGVAIKGEDLIPVDNFVYRVADELDVRLSGTGHQCVLSVKPAGCEGAIEWFSDYAEGLLRMADILDGSAAIPEFGKEAHPNLYANIKSGKLPVANVDVPPIAKGAFFVESILESGDIWPASALLYKTAEGRQAGLVVTPDTWAVTLCEPTGPGRERAIPLGRAAEALRVLSEVLKGTRGLSDF